MLFHYLSRSGCFREFTESVVVVSVALCYSISALYITGMVGLSEVCDLFRLTAVPLFGHRRSPCEFAP